MSDEFSLLDTPGKMVREWYVVYFPRVPYYRFTKFFRQGFRHIELWRPAPFGPGLLDQVWLRMHPCFEMLDAEIDTDPRPPWQRFPGVTVQRVTVSKPLFGIRSWFDMGPPSCVEIAKAALGIRAFFVRTPWQLYKYIRERDGVIT